MKLKKCMKRISATLLAATMVVTALPNQPKVQAEEFPEEILFPISILDFRADNLFFEYAPSWNGGGHGDDFANLQSGGRGFVETHLESDKDSIYYGLPVYKEEKVKRIAELTYQQLNYRDSAATVLDTEYIDGKINPISARHYIRRKDWVVLDAEDTDKYKEDYTNAHYGGIKHYSEIGGSAEISAWNDCLQGYGVGYIGGPGNGTVTFKYFNENTAGNYDIRIFAMSADPRKFNVTVNGTTTLTTANIDNDSWYTPTQDPSAILTGVPLRAGDNTIVFSGVGTDWAPNLDRIEISTVKATDTAPPDENALFTVEAENPGSEITIARWWHDNSPWGGWWEGNGEGSIVTDADPKLNYSNNGYAEIKNWNWSSSDGDLSNGSSYKSGSFNLSAGLNAGKYDIRVYYTRNADNYMGFVVNSNGEQGQDGAGANGDPTKNPFVISNVDLKKTGNVIRFRGNGTRIDKFVICKAGTGGLGAPALDDYPLGNYKESKEKFNVDRINNTTGAEEPDGVADYGWYDIETCFDYAYFISAHMFKSHPSLNKPYSDYNNLVFHKVEGDDPFPYYEFMGDKLHKSASDGLIYNPTNRSIRNGSNADVKTAEGEFRTTPGEMFIADRVTKDYPTIDTNYTTSTGTHNFLYTVRTHSRFVYKKGADQTFYFSGDDDVYVFINGQLLIDMGGAHEQQNGTFNLDDLAEENPELDLRNGKAVDFDFFYVERHTTESNFYGKMNFKLANDEVSLQWPEDIQNMEDKAIPYGWVVDLNYKFESNRELTTNKNIVFSDQFGNKIGYGKDRDGNLFTEGITLANGVRLRDEKQLIVTVTRDGKAEPEVTTFDFSDTTASSAEEKSLVAEFFKNLELEQGDTISIDGIIFDSSIRNFDSYDATEDPRVRKITFDTRADYEMYMTMGGTNKIEDTVAIPNHVTQSTTVNMQMGRLTVSAKIEGLGENMEARKDLSAYGKFTISRPESLDDPDTDEDERIVYQNQMDIAKGDNIIVFDAVKPEPPEDNTIYEKALPRGRYKLNMDTTVLTGYDLSVEIRVTKPNGDKVEVEVMKGDTKIVDGQTYSFDTLYLDLEPEIIGGKWVYPEVEYILKAIRKVNPLKDLT